LGKERERLKRKIYNIMKNCRILILGVAGSIGSELARQLCKDNDIFGVDISESGFFEIQQETNIYGRIGDIRDKATVFDVFSDFKPQVVINCAAYKHVPYSQIYPEEYVTTNVLGTLNLIQEAKCWESVKVFIQISTDKIHSKSVMGATKRCAEAITASMGDKFIAVRFGNVMWSKGSVLTIWKKQVEQGKPITITDPKMNRLMMSIEEACELVIKAGEIGKGGETICLDMGEPINILDLKNEHFGKDYPIEIIGERKGEVLEEILMSKEEEAVAVKQGKFFIIN